MRVEYFAYDSKRSLFAMASENINSSEICIILIGGMCDGPFSLPYSTLLHKSCSNTEVISIVHPVLRSSYLQFGIVSLDSDAEDICKLISQITTKKIVLMGHSTGCNAIIHLFGKYLVTNKFKDTADVIVKKIAGIILQGPVSDSQYLFSLLGEEKVNGFLKQAEELERKGKEDTIMPSEAFPMEPIVPMTAKRYISLVVGDDELFAIPKESTGPIHKTISEVAIKFPILIFISEVDDFVPTNIKLESIISYFSQISAYNSKNEILLLKKADHFLVSLSDETIREDFINPILKWCKEI